MAPSPPPQLVLKTTLARARSRLRLRVCVTALRALLVTAAALALSSLSLAGALDGGRLFRQGAALVALITVGFALVQLLLKPLRALRGDRAVAGQVESAWPRLKDALFASVQFAPLSGETARPLVDGLLFQTAHHLEALDWPKLFPLVEKDRWNRALLAAVLAWALMALLAPGLLSRGFTRLFPSTDALGAQLSGPLVGDLELTLSYPPHMKRPDRILENSSGELDAPLGTRVRLRATTLEPASEASLQTPPRGEATTPTTVPLTLTSGRDVDGEFVIEGPGSWRFAVEGEDGEARVESTARPIRIEADALPQLVFKTPASDLEVRDARALDVSFTATDDFGLSQVAVLVALADDLEHPERLEQPGVSGSRFEGEDEVELTHLSLQPGDRVAITIEAFDNDTISGPKKAVSVTRYVTVFSPEKVHFEAMEKLHALIELFISALADRLEFLPDEVPRPELLARAEALWVGTQGATQAFAAVVATLSDDPYTAKEVRMALAGRLTTLEHAVTGEKALLAAQGPALSTAQKSALVQHAKMNAETVAQIEATIILLEAMVTRLSLEDLMALTDELKASNEKIRELLRAYKERPEEALKARIKRDIARLKRRIAEIRDRIAKLRQDLPEEFLNVDGLKGSEVEKGLENADKELDSLEKLLDEGRIDEAMAALDELQKSLDSLQSQLGDDMNELNAETNPEMQRAISELMDQTRDLIKQQEQVSEETKAVEEAQNEAMTQQLEAQMKARLDSVKAGQAELSKRAAELDPKSLPPYVAEELDGLRQRIDDLGASLARPDLPEALEMSGEGLEHWQTLERAGRFAPESQSDGDRKKLAEGQALQRKVGRELGELLRDLQAQSPKAGAPQPGNLPERQQQASEGAQKLMQRLGQQQGAFPQMAGEGPKRLERAGEAMREASKHLRDRQPGQARPSQQQAESELQGLMQELEQAAQPQRAERQGPKEGGSRHRQEKVQIPGADEHEAPAEFRKHLLDAMKDQPPEDFEQSVKRYYESLVE